MAHSSLLVPVGPGLTIRFDGLAAPLGRRIETFLAYYLKDPDATRGTPILVSAEAPPEDGQRGETLLEEPPLVVRRSGGLTLFELPRVIAWCDSDAVSGGIFLDDPSASDLDCFVGMALASLLIELAVNRGWLGIHAAAASFDGVGILLPGPSGAGKSTIFSNLHRAGHAVLSDDLMWLRPTADGRTRLYAFPRGLPTDSTPWPTTDCAELGAFVCPEIVGRDESHLAPLPLAKLLPVLMDQSGFLGSRTAAGKRFRALVRLARSVPGYRLEAGRARAEVPPLLLRLSATLTDQARPRAARSTRRRDSSILPIGVPRRREETQ